MNKQKGRPHGRPFSFARIETPGRSIFKDFNPEGVPLIDFLDDVEAFGDLAEARVIPVQVSGVFAVVNDEKL